MPDHIRGQIPPEKAFENPRSIWNLTICPSKHASAISIRPVQELWGHTTAPAFDSLVSGPNLLDFHLS
jgi:hypothetical protein